MSLIQFIARNVSLIEKEMKEAPVSKFMKQIITVETIPTDTTYVSYYDFKMDNE